MHIRTAAVAMCLAAGSSAFGETPITLTFDPPTNPNGGFQLNSWTESGFLTSAQFGGFSQNAPNTSPLWPDNTSAFVQASLTTANFSVTNLSNTLFNANSVRLAEYSTVLVTPSVHVTGYKPGGLTTTVTFTLDQLIDGPGPNADFQSFTFPASFTGLNRLQFDNAFSMDDLQLTPVPAPAFAPVGLTAAVAFSRRRRR